MNSYNLRWGNRILRLIKELPGDAPLIAIIRHSERPPVDGISIKDSDNVGLTEEGFEAARMFGNLISQLKFFEVLDIFSWGSVRCSQTAKAIYEGAKTANNLDISILEPKIICLKSPIANREEYCKEVNLGKFHQIVNDWLNNDKPAVMVPVRDYAKTIIKEILTGVFWRENGISIITTHDLHILPLIKFFVISTPPWPLDFLDGIVLKANGDKISFGFDGRQISVSPDDLASAFVS